MNRSRTAWERSLSNSNPDFPFLAITSSMYLSIACAIPQSCISNRRHWRCVYNTHAQTISWIVWILLLTITFHRWDWESPPLWRIGPNEIHIHCKLFGVLSCHCLERQQLLREHSNTMTPLIPMAIEINCSFANSLCRMQANRNDFRILMRQDTICFHKPHTRSSQSLETSSLFSCLIHTPALQEPFRWSIWAR